MPRTPLFAVAAGVALFLLGAWWSYNALVGKQEAVAAAWSQVESNYQRRADLVPALVASVKRFLQHERDVLRTITEQHSRARSSLNAQVGHASASRAVSKKARAETGDALVSADRLTRFAKAQATLGHDLSRLLAVVEDYPELRSGDQFLRLQAQLEGTENRINIARLRYSQNVRAYNTAIRRFPGVLMARAMAFSSRPYFEADPGADKPTKALYE